MWQNKFDSGIVAAETIFSENRLSYGLDLNTPLCSVGIAHDALYALADDSKISFDIDTDAGGAFHFVFDIAKEFGDSFIKKIAIMRMR